MSDTDNEAAEATTSPEGTEETTEQEKPWYDGLPEDLKFNTNITKHSSVESLARSHASAQDLIGRDKIPMPKTETELLEVYNRLGRPETADKYNIPEIELPDGVEIDPELQKAFKERAHELGLSDRQAAGIFQGYWKDVFDKQSNIDNRNQIAFDEAHKDLRREWGETYDRRLTLSNRAIERFGGQEMSEFFKQAKLDQNPDIIRLFAKVGEEVLEDTELKGQGQAGQTPAEIDARIAEIYANPTYTDPNNNAGRQVLVNEVQSLLQRKERYTK